MKDLWLLFGWLKVRIVRPTAIYLYVGPVLQRSIIISEGTGPMDVALGDNQFRELKLSGFDPSGMAGTVNAKWESADPTIATVEPDATGATCILGAAIPPKLGTTVVTVTDSDDPSVPAVTINVTVGAEAVSRLEVIVGLAQERPAA